MRNKNSKESGEDDMSQALETSLLALKEKVWFMSQALGAWDAFGRHLEECGLCRSMMWWCPVHKELLETAKAKTGNYDCFIREGLPSLIFDIAALVFLVYTGGKKTGAG